MLGKPFSGNLEDLDPDDTTLYFKCDQASDLCQQLGWTSELESDLRDAVDWGRNWLVDFNAGKTELGLFDWSDVKMDESVLSWIGALTLSLLLKLQPRKLEP